MQTAWIDEDGPIGGTETSIHPKERLAAAKHLDVGFARVSLASEKDVWLYLPV